MIELPLIQFNPKLPRLSVSEKATLKLLVEAGKLIAPIYLEQEKQAKDGPSREEIEKSGKNDPEILSPYTVVEKIDGKLTATPYHIKYANLLAPISQKLNKAASITDNKEFAKALITQAKTLLDGSYEEAIITWLKTKPYILDIFIRPIKQFDSSLPFSKASYQSWVGVMDFEGTERFNNYKDITLSVARKDLTPKERVGNQEKVEAKVLDVFLLSGYMAKTKFVGVHLPIDVSIFEKYGASITLFNQPNDLRVEEQIIPTFNKIFSPGFKEGYNQEDLRRGYLRAVALHELAHTYLQYKNATDNLRDLFSVIDELAATILGLRMAGVLLLKDRITEKMLESMVVTFLCRSFFQKDKGNISTNPLHNYALGGSIFINFMLQNGAIKMSNEIVVPNFMKIFMALHELSDTLEHLLSEGSYKEAGRFIQNYGDIK